MRIPIDVFVWRVCELRFPSSNGMKIGGTGSHRNGKVQISTPISTVKKDKNFKEIGRGGPIFRRRDGTEAFQ
jgi:hypothetical protein